MVDRGDVSRMRSRWALATILIASVVWPHAADSDQPCEVVPMPCTFESLPFKFKVADAETHQPLADVHALAEWQRELQRVYAGRAFSRSDDQSLKFRVPYSNRLKLISNERDKTPADERRVGRFFWHVDRELKFL